MYNSHVHYNLFHRYQRVGRLSIMYGGDGRTYPVIHFKSLHALILRLLVYCVSAVAFY